MLGSSFLRGHVAFWKCRLKIMKREDLKEKGSIASSLRSKLRKMLIIYLTISKIAIFSETFFFILKTSVIIPIV